MQLSMAMEKYNVEAGPGIVAQRVRSVPLKMPTQRKPVEARHSRPVRNNLPDALATEKWRGAVVGDL